jgi:hypothetical protein
VKWGHDFKQCRNLWNDFCHELVNPPVPVSRAAFSGWALDRLGGGCDVVVGVAVADIVADNLSVAVALPRVKVVGLA